MKYISVVNLEKYQHYKEGRSTIWIKWYFKSLRDYKFCQLNNSERWLFVGLVILGVESSNQFPYDALAVRDACCYRSPNSVERVRKGLAKMLKLGLIRVENAIIEKIREDNIRKDSYNNLPNYLKPVKRVLEEHVKSSHV
jgi:hypothetical protein